LKSRDVLCHNIKCRLPFFSLFFSSFVNFIEGDPIYVIASTVGVLMSLNKSLPLLRSMVLGNAFRDRLLLANVPLNNASCISSGSLQKSKAECARSRLQKRA
jgi:hypothetical protein